MAGTSQFVVFRSVEGGPYIERELTGTSRNGHFQSVANGYTLSQDVGQEPMHLAWTFPLQRKTCIVAVAVSAFATDI